MTTNQQQPTMPIDHDSTMVSVTKTDESRETVSVGTRVAATQYIGHEDVQRFAVASGDENGVHMDDEYAEAGRFGERIAHGVLIQGVVSGALAKIPGCPILVSTSANYQAPVSVNSYVTAVVEIVEDLGGDQYRVATRAQTADGETVTTGEAVILLDDHPDGVTV